MPNILIIEDDYLISLGLQTILRQFGCQTVGPLDAVEAAVARIKQGGIDAAVVDFNLKGGSALPVADALIEEGIPFVFSTGQELSPEVKQRYPGVGTLTKPFGPGDLQECLLDRLT